MDDIDALKRELQQTRLAYHLAVAINHLKSSFLGRVAHELRSPLSSMISLHQLILADLCESPAEEREFIAQGQLAGCKLMAMLDEMINLSKLESGALGEKKVTITLEFPGEIALWQMPEISPLSLESKPEEVKQFTQALGLSPGLKFQLAKGIIEVSGGEMSLDKIDNNSQDKLTGIVFSLPRSPDRKTPRDND